MNYKNSRFIKRYRKQRRRATQRDIPWLFSYVTWRKMWWESGKWGQRGVKRGNYVMARFGDKGPYSPDNVRICTASENHKEKRLSPEAKRKFISAGYETRFPRI